MGLVFLFIIDQPVFPRLGSNLKSRADLSESSLKHRDCFLQRAAFGGGLSPALEGVEHTSTAELFETGQNESNQERGWGGERLCRLMGGRIT